MRRNSFATPLLLILVAALAVSACSASTGAIAGAAPFRAAAGSSLSLDGVTMVADNGLYSLWVDPEHASFEVRSRAGVVWRSLPEHTRDPDWVNAMLVNNLSSIISVTALDASLARQELSCYEYCVTGGTVRYESIPDGVRFIFRYGRQGITVPLDIYLTETGFLAQVAPGDIVEDGTFLLNQITLLPYFNGGTSADEGFLFYPDGSGAISVYDKDYENTPDITQPVYGFDRGIGTVESVSRVAGYRMPVYGVRTNDASYLAVIEEPSSFISSVTTGVMRPNNRYFKNGAVFTFRDIGRVFLRESNTSVTTSYTIPAPVKATAPLSVSYLLLEGGAVGYVDMAAAYRQYLERAGVLTHGSAATGSAATNAHVTLMGAVVKPSSFLGVPMEREITLTTFKQAGEITDALHDAGVGRLSLVFKGAQQGGYNSQWTRGAYPFNNALGNERGWKEFLTNVNKNYGDNVYLNYELLQVYKAGRGFSSSRDAARTTGGGLNFQYDNYIQDGTRNSDSRRWYLLSPSLWEMTFGGITQASSGADWGVAVEDAGMLIYSNYDKNEPVFRDVTGELQANLLRSLDNPALPYGNAYVWPASSTLYDVPLGASGFFIQSFEVPFYQLVVRGYIEYSGEAMNLSPDKQRALLRSVEYGALPHYFGIYAPSSELNRSILAGMFSACYLDWIDVASDQAAQARDFFNLVAGQGMTGHEQAGDGIYRTTFENGVAVTVNYNTRSFTYG